MAKTKAPKAKKVLEPLSQEYYQEVFKDLVHFSFKTVNSNTVPGGIRLTSEDAVPELGYITARGLLSEGVLLELDYIKNYGKVATALKHMRIAKHGSKTETLADPEVVLKASALAVTGRLEIGTDSVAPRLRQILLPLDHSRQRYLSVTPLVSGGLCKHINQAVITSNNSDRKRITTARLGIGGANSQNVGALVRDMQSPMFFNAPSESPELKNAYRLHYQGLKILLPRPIMQAYFDWRKKSLLRGAGRVSSSLRSRQTEMGFIVQLVDITLKRAASAQQLLAEHKADLPGAELFDPALGLVQQGLLDSEARSRPWCEAFAEAMALHIASFRFDGNVGLGMDQSGQAGIAAMIEELLA